ncbi:hypothetical protein B0G77_4294 [Paraburkholderia sp. BL10I2N1]|nr:hypothetical protein B0G77_4294 [Paraburkholderia sp. BL10I2N1]
MFHWFPSFWRRCATVSKSAFVVVRSGACAADSEWPLSSASWDRKRPICALESDASTTAVSEGTSVVRVCLPDDERFFDSQQALLPQASVSVVCDATDTNRMVIA